VSDTQVAQYNRVCYTVQVALGRLYGSRQYKHGGIIFCILLPRYK